LPTDDWKSPEVWRKTNPSLGITIREDEFSADVREAEKSPSTQTSFKRYSFNIWATSRSPWLKMEDWQKCARKYKEEDLAGRDCWGCFDIAKKFDTTAFVLVFPELDEPDAFCLLTYFWLPKARLQDVDCPEHYKLWAAENLLCFTDGEVTDYSFVKKGIGELNQRYRIQQFAYDPCNAEHLTQEIESEFGIKRFEFAQTMTNFADPTSEFERLTIAGRMHHNGHPVMTWQIGNVSVHTDVSNRKRPVKPNDQDPRKIDGPVGGIMGLALAKAGGLGGSVYEKRGILEL